MRNITICTFEELKKAYEEFRSRGDIIMVGLELSEKTFSEYDWISGKTANPNRCGYEIVNSEFTGHKIINLYNSIQLDYMAE